MNSTPTAEQQYEVYKVVGRGIVKSLADVAAIRATNPDVQVHRIVIDFDPDAADHLKD